MGFSGVPVLILGVSYTGVLCLLSEALFSRIFHCNKYLPKGPPASCRQRQQEGWNSRCPLVLAPQSAPGLNPLENKEFDIPNVFSIGFHMMESVGPLAKCTDKFQNKEDTSRGQPRTFPPAQTISLPRSSSKELCDRLVNVRWSWDGDWCAWYRNMGGVLERARAGNGE